MNHTNSITMHIGSKAEFQLIDQMITLETKRRLLLVPEAKSFNVWTACYIDGAFNCVSEYQLEEEIFEKLKSV